MIIGLLRYALVALSSISNVYVTRSIKKNFSAYLCWEQEVLWSSVVNLGSKLLTLVVFTLSVTQLPPRKDAWYGFDVCDKNKIKIKHCDVTSPPISLWLCNKNLGRILEKYLYHINYSQTCLNDHHCKLTTSPRQPTLSLFKSIPIRSFLYKTNTCQTWPAVTFFALLLP